MNKLIYSLLGLSLAVGANAQNALSLEEVQNMAKENNIASRKAQYNTEMAELQKKEAFTNYFPTISATGLAATFSDYLIDVNLAGMPIQMIDDIVYGSVSATQPLFAGGQIVNGNRLAKVGVEVAEIQQEVSENDVETTASQYYWNVVSLEEKLRTVNAVSDMLDQLYNDVEAAVNAGVTMRNDLLQVQLRKNEVEATKIKIESNLRICKMVLAQYIGAETDTVNVAADVPIGSLPDFPADLRQNPDDALAATPEYRLLEQNVKAKKMQKKMETGSHLPTVAVGASYSAYKYTENWDNGGTLFGVVSVPLSDWWGGSRAIKSKKIALQQAEEEMADNSALLKINIQKLWIDIEDAYKQLAIAQRGIEQSAENLRLNKDYYAAGTSAMSDLLDAQMSYQQTRDNYIDSWATYQMSIIAYKQATGM